MSTTTTSDSVNSTSTNGWDTVYAAYFPDVNSAIVSTKASPTSFTTGTIGNYQAEGTFGDWQLTTGGAGPLVHMVVPIPSSTVTLYNPVPEGAPSGTQPTINTQYKCTEIQFVIEVNLAWVVADQPATSTTGGTSNILKVNSDAGVSMFTSKTDWTGSGCTNIMAQIMYGAVLKDWFNANASIFNYIFSKINLNTILAEHAAGFQWLMPTGTPLYAVVDGDESDISKSIFAVLCMTEGRPSPNVNQVDPGAIPANANGSFLISPQRVLSNMLLQGMPYIFSNSTVADFTISPLGGLSLSNNTALNFNELELYPTRTVTPTVQAGNFTLSLVDSELQLSVSGMSYDWSPGVTVSIDHTSTATLSLNTKGQFKMDMIASTFSANISNSAAVVWSNIAGAIVASIAGAVLGGMIGSAVGAAGVAAAEGAAAGVGAAADASIPAISNTATAGAADGLGNVASVATGRIAKLGTWVASNWQKLLGTVIGGALGGSTGTISKIIDLIATNQTNAEQNVPSLDEFSQNVMGPVTWPNAKNLDDITTVSGKLNGPLQIGLSLFSSTPPATGND